MHAAPQEEKAGGPKQPPRQLFIRRVMQEHGLDLSGDTHQLLDQAARRALVQPLLGLTQVHCQNEKRGQLLDDLADAVIGGTRKEFMESVATVPLLIIGDFGMRKLPLTAAEDLLEIIMRRYERASTLLTSNRPVEDWGKQLSDVAAVTAMLDRILHHGHVLKCGPRSWRTKAAAAKR